LASDNSKKRVALIRRVWAGPGRISDNSKKRGAPLRLDPVIVDNSKKREALRSVELVTRRR
jgi:hypothetical protein